MSLEDACFEFLDRLEKEGEMTEKNVREFLRDINHYSKDPWEPNARNRALKYAAQEFLEGVKDTTNKYQSMWISWSGGWLRALAEVVNDEWHHGPGVHPNMRGSFAMRKRSCIWDEANSSQNTEAA